MSSTNYIKKICLRLEGIKLQDDYWASESLTDSKGNNVIIEIWVWKEGVHHYFKPEIGFNLIFNDHDELYSFKSQNFQILKEICGGVKFEIRSTGKRAKLTIPNNSFQKFIDSNYKNDKAAIEWHIKNYKLLVDLVNNFSSKTIDRRLMRLTWNENNWEHPSKKKWRKSDQGKKGVAYEKQYGFGHEEWLFDSRFRLNGYQYGYIRGVGGMSEEEEFLDEIQLFTIDENTKNRYLIGILHNVEIIDGYEEELKLIQPVIDRYTGAMSNELKASKADFKHFEKTGFRPNVKFKWSDAIIYNDKIPCKYLEGYKYNRFQPFILNEILQKNLSRYIVTKNTFNFQSGKGKHPHEYEVNAIGGKSKVKRPHTQIVDDLYDYLFKVNKINEAQLSKEKTKVGSATIDLVIQETEGYHIFEAKTRSTGLKNIREALGQILEYAYLDQSIKIKQLTIVGPANLDEVEMEYFKKIKSLFKIPLDYWAYEPNEKLLKDRFITIRNFETF